ncbi:MAG TPA: hypothetical protein PKI92_00405 [Candidatus Woesebacteria bacterium]|nr:hypothetical protein [Candidatus Woesebacteria bacterium]HPR99340.1 hypothetical protein [Candidatus Woesebacteria bacterium]
MKSILFFLSFLVSSFSFLASPSPLRAQGTQAWTGRCVGTGTNSDVATIQGFECLFYNILQVIVTIAGLAFLFMFISGGYKYLFSGGESKAVAAASSAITSAFIGLIGVIASWLILKLIQDFTGINVTIFKIPGNP